MVKEYNLTCCFEMFHRTESLDFGILHSGEITWYDYLTLDLITNLLTSVSATLMMEFA